MPIMAKKKNPPDDSPGEWEQFTSLRFDSEPLLRALDACAKDRRQSRNNAILTLLETALRDAGYLKDAPKA